MLVTLEGPGPTYLRLYRGLRRAIAAARLASGAALPSTRELANDLELSRNTVLRAYEQLIADGIAASRPGGGTFVARPIAEPAARTSTRGAPELALSAQGRRSVAALAASPFVEMAALPPVPHDFLWGVPDAALFPIEAWRRTVSRCFERASKRSLSYGGATGVMRLRELVAAHVVEHRAMRCTAKQVLIANGAQQALDLVARVLVDPGDVVIVEEPCYPAARAIFAAAGARVVAAPVDRDGIDLSTIAPATRDRARLCYVTPTHQFPTGAVMSEPRRRALLDWAERTGAVVIEDDYDSEYRYAGPRVAALQALDPARVVHVGTFSKSLFPSLRLAYVVAPRALVGPLSAAKWLADWSSSELLQHAVADFIASGQFARHLKRSRAIYARRRDALLVALERELGEVEVWGQGGGIHLVAWLAIEPRALELAIRRARARGVGMYSIAPFYERPPARAGIVLGYSGLAERAIAEGIAEFGDVLRTGS